MALSADVPLWAQVLIALAGGGLVSGLTSTIRFLREQRKMYAEGTAAEFSTSTSLFEEVQRLRTRILNVEASHEACRREKAELTVQLARVTALLPFAVTSGRMVRGDQFGKFLDLFAEPLTISSLVQGGTFTWVNAAFCLVMERTMEECIAAGWRGMIHPGDIPDTTKQETGAWDEPIWGFVNRYLSKSGKVVWFRWYCLSYEDGLTLAMARIEKVVEKEN